MASTTASDMLFDHCTPSAPQQQQLPHATTPSDRAPPKRRRQISYPPASPLTPCNRRLSLDDCYRTPAPPRKPLYDALPVRDDMVTPSPGSSDTSADMSPDSMLSMSSPSHTPSHTPSSRKMCDIGLGNLLNERFHDVPATPPGPRTNPFRCDALRDAPPAPPRVRRAGSASLRIGSEGCRHRLAF